MNQENFCSIHKVRPFECDFYGHVNNAIYLNYLEFARMELLEQKGLTLNRMKEAGVMLVIRKIAIEYKVPAISGDIIEIRSQLRSYRNTGGVFHQQIVRQKDEKLLAEADVEWVTVNRDGRPIRVPNFIRKPFGLPLLKHDSYESF